VRLGTDIAARVALTVATARSVQRLRASEERYRRIVETSMDGVGEVETDGVITFVNERLAEMLGQAPADVIGRPMISFVAETDRARISRRLTDRLPGATDRPRRETLHPADPARRGQPRPAEHVNHGGAVSGVPRCCAWTVAGCFWSVRHSRSRRVAGAPRPRRQARPLRRLWW
jgi:PAS domain S-box-containing protein